MYSGSLSDNSLLWWEMIKLEIPNLKWVLVWIQYDMCKWLRHGLKHDITWKTILMNMKKEMFIIYGHVMKTYCWASTFLSYGYRKG